MRAQRQKREGPWKSAEVSEMLQKGERIHSAQGLVFFCFAVWKFSWNLCLHIYLFTFTEINVMVTLSKQI